MADESFGIGPELWVNPTPACPRCSCCTLDLCERGRADAFIGCRIGSGGDPELDKRLAECPCGSGPGSLLYEMDQAAQAFERGEIDENEYKARILMAPLPYEPEEG